MSRFLNLHPRLDSEFEDEYDTVVPVEGEVRLIANRNNQCQYYYKGIAHCRDKVLKSQYVGDEKFESFIQCKRIADAHYRCMTEDKYGYALEDAPQFTKQHVLSFSQCVFKDLHPVTYCRAHFDNIIREIYRSSNCKLDDSS